MNDRLAALLLKKTSTTVLAIATCVCTLKSRRIGMNSALLATPVTAVSTPAATLTTAAAAATVTSALLPLLPPAAAAAAAAAREGAGPGLAAATGNGSSYLQGCSLPSKGSRGSGAWGSVAVRPCKTLLNPVQTAPIPCGALAGSATAAAAAAALTGGARTLFGVGRTCDADKLLLSAAVLHGKK
jgi:hypothetical protein